MLTSDSETLHVYTDGSCIGMQQGDPHIGWGAVTDAGVLASGHQHGGTNINAEVMAVRDGLRSLIFRKNLPSSIILHVDCKFVLDTVNRMLDMHADGSLEDWYHDPEQGRDQQFNYQMMRQAVNFVQSLSKKGITVSLEKIKAHQVHIGNCFADYVATSESKISKLEVSEC